MCAKCNLEHNYGFSFFKNVFQFVDCTIIGCSWRHSGYSGICHWGLFLLQQMFSESYPGYCCDSDWKRHPDNCDVRYVKEI